MLRFFIVVLFVVGVFFSVNTQEWGYTDSVKAEVLHTLKDFPDGSQFSIAIVEADTVYFFGFKKDFNEVLTVDNRDQHFEIGSITKVFTSTLLSMAVQEEKIKLDRKINKDLPFNLNQKQKISYLQLANHTSGLPRLTPDLMMSALLNPDNPYAEYNETKFKEYLQKELELTKNQEGKYVYSNVGAGLLAYTMSFVYEKPFDTLLQEKIFSHYKMKETSFDKDSCAHTLVKGIDGEGFETENWSFSAMKGAGGLFSTVAELAIFAQAHFDETDEALSLTRQKTLDITGDFGIAMGWHVISKEDHTVYWHNGGTGGYSSSLSMDVNQKKAVIVLTNISGLSSLNKKIDPLCFSLINKITR